VVVGWYDALMLSKQRCVGVVRVFNGLLMFFKTLEVLLSARFTMCPAKFKKRQTPVESLARRLSRLPRQATNSNMKLLPLFGGGNSSYTPGNFSFEDAFWDATLLGQAVQNPGLVGDGWFPNARIYEAQAEEARKLRGTVDGKALTAGRALATVVAQPRFP